MPLCGDTFDEKVGAARASADARERRLVVPHQDARSTLGTAGPTFGLIFKGAFHSALWRHVR